MFSKIVGVGDVGTSKNTDDETLDYGLYCFLKFFSWLSFSVFSYECFVFYLGDLKNRLISYLNSRKCKGYKLRGFTKYHIRVLVIGYLHKHNPEKMLSSSDIDSMKL